MCVGDCVQNSFGFVHSWVLEDKVHGWDLATQVATWKICQERALVLEARGPSTLKSGSS